MENMAHCRFENTLAALHECECLLHINGKNPLSALSHSERLAAIHLLELCKNMAEDYERVKL